MLSAAGVRRGGAQAGKVRSRRGDVLVSQAQRSRMISSAAAVIAEQGYGEMSVARITGRAGVSRRTFYDLFEDREDCFLAVFEDTAARAGALVLAAYRSERGWQAQTRAALRAFLGLLDQEPGARSLLVIDALKAGPRVQQRRAALLEQLSGALHQGGSAARPGRGFPALTGEGVVGAVLGVIHTRLMTPDPGAMLDLLNPLMGVIVLPYLGPAAAERELVRPAPAIARASGETPRHSIVQGEALAELPMRITYRTLLVLSAIGEHPGGSNRQVADRAGISDQGQISKLLTRLQSIGLIENSGGQQPNGEPNRWRLTARGQTVQRAIQMQSPNSTRHGEGGQ